MNNDYFFLENFCLLIQEGYSLQAALLVCSKIKHHRDIDFLIDYLNQGYSIDEAIEKSHLPPTFKEYFHFYQKKNVLSQSIENSLKICKMQNNYLSKIKKQLSYPMMLLVFLLFFSIFVIFILLPKVNELYASFGIKRNMFIQVVMSIFKMIPLIFVMLIVLLIVCGIHLYKGLKHKNYKVIEFYLDKPIIGGLLQKYFSLKFSLYYNELLEEKLDSNTIIHILNQQLIHSDLKIVLYEIEERMMNGELIEDILEDFIYFDELFIIFFRMILEHPGVHLSLQNYIDISFHSLEIKLNRFMKILTSGVYVFVALFVIMVYISIIIPMMNVISEI